MQVCNVLIYVVVLPYRTVFTLDSYPGPVRERPFGWSRTRDRCRRSPLLPRPGTRQYIGCGRGQCHRRDTSRFPCRRTATPGRSRLQTQRTLAVPPRRLQHGDKLHEFTLSNEGSFANTSRQVPKWVSNAWIWSRGPTPHIFTRIGSSGWLHIFRK